MSTLINEPVAVATVFERGKITPLAFRWQGRKIIMTEISFRWETKEGAVRLLHFSAVSGGTVYELVFNTHNFSWVLTQVAL